MTGGKSPVIFYYDTGDGEMAGDGMKIMWSCERQATMIGDRKQAGDFFILWWDKAGDEKNAGYFDRQLCYMPIGQSRRLCNMKVGQARRLWQDPFMLVRLIYTPLSVIFTSTAVSLALVCGPDFLLHSFWHWHFGLTLFDTGILAPSC